MKKLMSILLAVAVVTTMACSMVGFRAFAAETTQSILPATVDGFMAVSAGEGNVTITAEGDGYKLVADGGWPNAIHHRTNDADFITVNKNDETAYIEFDLEVKTGETSVLVFFCGQNPEEFAAIGNYVCLNAAMMEDDSYVNSLTGEAVKNVPVGTYKGKIAVSDIRVNPDIILEDGTFTISGCKIFAVGGEVIVNKLALVSSAETAATSTTTVSETTTTTAETAATQVTTTSTVAATTTQAVTADESDETGNSVLPVVIVIVVVVVAAAGGAAFIIYRKKAGK